MSVYSHDTLSAHHQWDFSGCGMAEFSFGLGHVECLPFSRLKSYLTDPDPCFAISVEGFQFNEQRRARALAEIDGVIAGLQFLGKIEKDHGDDPYPSREQSAADHLFSDLTDNTHWSRQQRQVHIFDRWLPPPHKARCLPNANVLITRDSIDRLADINLHEDFNDDGPEPDFPVENTGDVGKAWKGLRAVRKGMKAEFRRFDDVTSKSKSAVIGRLRSRFPNFKALADCGALVYRDVLDGLCPGTFEEIFAFASLSHAMSRILVRQKRMEEAQVLSGVQRWRDCIDNVDERSAFDALTSRVWPSSCVFPTKPGQPAPDPHSQTITLEVQDKMRLLHKVATIATTEMGHGSGDASHAGTPGSPPASLEEDALNLTVLTGEEFDFSLLRHLSSSDTYVPPKDIDPRELSKFCPPGQHIPGYNPSLFLPPPPEDRPPTPTQPSPGDQTPPPPSPPALMGPASCGQTLYRFPITDEVFDCKATNLRNTITVLAVLAFASNSGDGFYLLSGSGKTTARNRIGSAWASERSKTERRLRREFFDPLKTAGADDASFLALLAVAKKFVVLGLLGTEVEVQDYLIAMSKVK